MGTIKYIKYKSIFIVLYLFVSGYDIKFIDVNQ